MQWNARASGARYELKLRSDLHISRKIFHNLGILSILVIYHNLTYSQSVQLAGTMLALVLGIDLLRLRIPAFQSLIVGSFRRVMRGNELKGLTGTTYLLMGVFFVVFFFPKNIASLSLLLLAFGDPISSIVGVTYGKDKLIGNKSLQGFLGGFAICTLVSLVFFYSKGLMLERILLVSILSGMIGAISELIPLGKLDDNLSFPVIASILLFLLFQLFGGFPPL